MKEKRFARAIVDKAKEYCGLTKDSELAKKILNVSSPSLSGAISRGSLPDEYYKAIENACGVSKDELSEIANKIVNAGNQVLTTGDNKNNFTVGGGEINVSSNKNSAFTDKEVHLITLLRKYGGEFKLDQHIKQAEQYRDELLGK